MKTPTSLKAVKVQGKTTEAVVSKASAARERITKPGDRVLVVYDDEASTATIYAEQHETEGGEPNAPKQGD